MKAASVRGRTYVGNSVVMLFLQVAPRFDVVLVLVPALIVAAVVLEDASRFVHVVGNFRLVRTGADSRRRVGLGRFRTRWTCRLVHYAHSATNAHTPLQSICCGFVENKSTTSRTSGV